MHGIQIPWTTASIVRFDVVILAKAIAFRFVSFSLDGRKLSSNTGFGCEILKFQRMVSVGIGICLCSSQKTFSRNISRSVRWSRASYRRWDRFWYVIGVRRTVTSYAGTSRIYCCVVAKNVGNSVGLKLSIGSTAIQDRRLGFWRRKSWIVQ